MSAGPRGYDVYNIAMRYNVKTVPLFFLIGSAPSSLSGESGETERRKRFLYLVVHTNSGEPCFLAARSDNYDTESS
jgi:hypothetical protein